MGMPWGVTALVFLTVGIAIFVAVMPTQLAHMTNQSFVNTSHWSNGAKGLYAIMPIVIVGFILFNLLPINRGGGEE